MDINQLRLLRLISGFLNSENIDMEMEAFEHDNWIQILKCMVQQGMPIILFPYINKYIKEKNLKVFYSVDWANNVMIATIQQLNNVLQIKQIMSALQSENLSVILFKGLAIAQLYPEPEHRLISDLDLFIKIENLKSSAAILNNMGYTLMEEKEKERHPLHFTYKKANFITVELHTSLLIPGLLDSRKTTEWYCHIWEKSRAIYYKDYRFTAMSMEDELINQILHFATHIIYSGAKLKHMFDISMIMKSCKSDFDWIYVNDTLQDLGLKKFATLISDVLNKYFNVEKPGIFDDPQQIETESFMSNFLNMYSVEENPGDHKGWLILVWKMPFLCRMHIPLVLIWLFEVVTHIRAGFMDLFRKPPRELDDKLVLPNRKSISFLFRNSLRNASIFKSKTQFLREMGLSG